MATNADDTDELAQAFGRMNIDTQTGPPECWNDAIVEVLYKDGILRKPLKIPPHALQYMVEGENSILYEILKKHGFYFERESSRNKLTVRYEVECTGQDLDDIVERGLIPSLNSLGSVIGSEVISIDDRIWPFVQKEFNEIAKEALEDGFFQVIRKSKNSFLLVGYHAKNIERNAAKLRGIEGKYEACRIKNMELFVVLQIKSKLQSSFKDVEICVHGNHLVLKGEKQIVNECKQKFEELSNLQNMTHETRVISKGKHDFLSRGKTLATIKDLVLQNGFNVYWTLNKQGNECYLHCFGYSKIAEAADFFTENLVKEWKVPEAFLKNVNFQTDNAAVYKSEDAENVIIVWCGNIEFPAANKEIWISKVIDDPEQLKFLQFPDVEKFVKDHLKSLSRKEEWKIDHISGKIEVFSKTIEDAECIVSEILGQICKIIQKLEILSNRNLVSRFCQEHLGRVLIIDTRADCCVFYVTKDIVDELHNLFRTIQEKEKAMEGAKSGRKTTILLTPVIQRYMKTWCTDEMTKIQEQFAVNLSFQKTNLELMSTSENAIHEAEKALLELLKGISYQRESVRIRRDITNKLLGNCLTELNSRELCALSLSRNVGAEPRSLDCWDVLNFCIVVAEGDVESASCDVLVCSVDESFMPVGKSAERIFEKGGWTEMKSAAMSSIEVRGNKWTLRSSKSKVFSSPMAGSLKCRNILYVCSENLERDIDEIWSKISETASENLWHSVCFPLDTSLIEDDKSLHKLLSVVAKGRSKSIQSRLELMFCIKEVESYLQTKLLRICQTNLREKFFPIKLHVEEVGEKPGSSKGLVSPIKVKLEFGSFLDIANAKKVDVIVNSTNTDLKLQKGFVSSLILNAGGKGIEEECKETYQAGIGVGEIAVTSSGELGFQKIFHGVLYGKWISTGNFSLKVLKCLVTRCLLATKKHKFSTIAFPALGTGKLGYPYLPVAKTMMEAVNDFGRQFPDTCIRTVYIVLHESEKECKKVFQDVFESPVIGLELKVEDLILKPQISFMESRFSERDILIQLMSEDDDPVDALIKFSPSTEGGSGDVFLTWCSENGCYTANMSVDVKYLKEVVNQCITMLDCKRITSTRIDIMDIQDPGALKVILGQFDEKLTLPVNVNENIVCRCLKRLKILVCQEQYKKLEQNASAEVSQSSWMPQIFQIKKGNGWKVIHKKRPRDVLCCALGSSSGHVQETLGKFKEEAGMKAFASGKWCFCKDFKWKYLSRVLNIKLNEAVEDFRLADIDVMDEDGILYNYDFDMMVRRPTNSTGDVKSEFIRCIPDDEGIASKADTNLWCVLHKDQWMFLPKPLSAQLNDARSQGKKTYTDRIGDQDGQRFTYDFMRMQRGLVKEGNKERNKQVKEEIMCIEAKKDGEKVKRAGEDALTTVQPQSELEPNENAVKDDLQIFEVVTGIISFQESANKDTKENIVKRVQAAGCKVTQGNRSVQIEGTLSQVLEVNQQLSAVKDETTSLESTEYIIRIPMSERDFKVFSHFGNRCEWFKKWGNSIHYKDQVLICIVSANEGSRIEEGMKKHLNDILMMNTDHIEMKDNKGISVEQVMQEVSTNYPNVCLVHKDGIIEIVCDSYPDLLQVKALLQQKVSGKGNRRARRFAKTESESEKTEEATATDQVVYKRRFNTDSTFQSDRDNQTMSLPMVKMETDEGIVVKIYTGSITRLEVDCIVNAANENLWHGGGVAAAISEAAGYEFDEESKQYVARNGPIPVGSCGVTSAGKLPYKYVIHTVGPRWGDYRDKNRCLDDLRESVEVTFREADRLGMKSIALPAISSGIFAVPRDQCIEQYYRAVMTFSRIHPFKSLQEIHFVDRDSSMVGAIQEIFKQRSSSYTPANQKPQLTDDDKLSSIHKKDQSNEQYGSPDSIINVSAGFLIKLHLGNITDAMTDVVVCPQDEYCLSNGQIAKAIFRMIPDKFRSSHGRKKFGDILPQNIPGNSQWKMIIHAVTPRWNKDSAKDPQKYVDTLNRMIQEILKSADASNFSSIAIPLLGAGVGEYQTPMETCARSFYKAVKAAHSELIHLKEIHLVVKDEAAEKGYLDMFEEGGFKIIPKTILNTGKSMSGKDWGKTIKGSSQSTEQENCCICMDIPTNPKRLQKCGHIFCKECIEQCFEYKPACPSCGEFYGKVMGDQPLGSISIKKDYQRLEGFNDCRNSIVVTYTFLNGSQGPEHPNPGKWYKGIVRSGYIPNNERGRLVAKLLNVAFSRRLVFTIGHSRTTGQDGVITWNDIHHKTRPTGGPERFGYPDDTYLDRVLEELAAKGVTPESADDPLEYSEYSYFIKYRG